MDFLKRAKDSVLQTVGLTADIKQDERLVQYLKRVNQLNAIVRSLKTKFIRYSDAVVAVSATAVSMSHDISQFYKKSQSRQASVELFTTEQREIDIAARRIFKEEFGWEVVKIFDDWDADTATVRKQIHKTERAHNQYAELNKQYNDLLAGKEKQDKRGQRLHSKASEAIMELKQKVDKYREQLKRMKANLEKTVVALLEGRFEQFDKVFVRLMECQVEFFRKTMQSTVSFKDNIDNYRRRFPRNIASQQPKRTNPDTLEMEAKRQNEPFSSDEEAMDVVPVSDVPVIQKNVSHSDDMMGFFATDDNDSNMDQSDEAQTGYKQNYEQQSNGFVAQTDAKQSSASDDAGFSFWNESPAASPTDTTQPESVSNGGGDGLLDFASGDSDQGFASKAGEIDNLNLFGETPAVRNSVSKTPAPVSATTVSTAGWGGLGFVDPNKASKSKHDDLTADPLFSFVQETADILQVDDVDTHVEDTVQNLRNSQAGKEAEEEHKRVTANDLEAKLHAWQYKNGVEKSTRTLLGSLHTVLWEGSKWKKPDLTALMEFKGVKRSYMRACMVTHPDHSRTAPMAQQVIAAHTFQALNKSFQKFREEQQR